MSRSETPTADYVSERTAELVDEIKESACASPTLNAATVRDVGAVIVKAICLLAAAVADVADAMRRS